jgi:hypothetical protein
MFYFIESATIIIFFARLVHFQGERGVVKKGTLCTLVMMMKKMGRSPMSPRTEQAQNDFPSNTSLSIKNIGIPNKNDLHLIFQAPDSL